MCRALRRIFRFYPPPGPPFFNVFYIDFHRFSCFFLSFLPHSTGRPAFLVLLPLHFSSPNLPGRDPAQRAENQSKTAKSRFLGVDFCGKLCSSAVQALQLLSRGGSVLRRPAAVVDHGLAP